MFYHTLPSLEITQFGPCAYNVNARFVLLFWLFLRTSKLSVPESFELLKSHRLLKSCNGPHM